MDWPDVPAGEDVTYTWQKGKTMASDTFKAWLERQAKTPVLECVLWAITGDYPPYYPDDQKLREDGKLAYHRKDGRVIEITLLPAPSEQAGDGRKGDR